jgi:hypothetical protein
MIDFSKADRSRPDSVWVNNVEYKIHTEFFYWINFEKIILRKDKDVLLDELDHLYVWGIPEDRQAGYEKLFKFYRNEQPLPKDIGKESGVKSFDWIMDSERIRAAFLSVYHIDLLTADLHWHDFLGLFGALFWPLNSVVNARLYKEKPDKSEKIDKENREMWELEIEDERPIFKMR